jgi:selenide, water dikinase
MDNSVVALKYPGLYLISTTDFFYPNVEDPLLQGRITACNVLSDLYANAVTEVDTVLMLLAVSTDMSPAQQSIVTAQIIRGFHETVREAGSSVTGGQTIFNASPLIGGVASRRVYTCAATHLNVLTFPLSPTANARTHAFRSVSVRSERDFIRPDGCRPGDVLVLTKPLGTQVAVNLWQWRGSAKWDRVAHIASMELATAAYNAACESMSRLNLIRMFLCFASPEAV